MTRRSRAALLSVVQVLWTCVGVLLASTPGTDATTIVSSIRGASCRRGGTSAFSMSTARQEARLPFLLRRLVQTQSTVTAKQANLILYSKTTGGSERTQAYLQERLVDLSMAEATNTGVYEEFEGVLGCLSRKGNDLSSLSAQIAKIQADQRAIEASHQQLEKTYGSILRTALIPEEDRIARGEPARTMEPAASGEQRPLPEESGGTRPSRTVATASVARAKRTPSASVARVGNESAGYWSRLSEIQATLSSMSASSEEKQSAYRAFLKIKTEMGRVLGGK